MVVCVAPPSLASLLFTTRGFLSCWLLCVPSQHFSFSPQEYFVTKFSKAVFPLSNLVAPFRKPAWKDGSTATCVLAVDNILYIANLGDSRVSGTEKPTTGISGPLQASLALQGDVCYLPYCWQAGDTGETLQSLRTLCRRDDSCLSVFKLSFILDAQRA